MSAAVQPAQVEIHDNAIDHVNVIPAKKSESAQNWIALTPLLTVMITGLGLLFTFGFNVYQNRTTERQKIDSDWREALSKGIDHDQSAALIALEMETFANDPVYGTQARSIIYSSLAQIESEVEFDTAFKGAVHSAVEDDEDALVGVVRKLSLAVGSKYDAALKTDMGAAVAEKSLAHFVMNPEAFLADNDPALAQMNVLTYKLDSASGALGQLWRGSKTKHALRPGPVDLSGLIFLNGDFHGVDFSQVTDMSKTSCLGSCNVGAAILPKGVTLAGETK